MRLRLEVAGGDGFHLLNDEQLALRWLRGELLYDSRPAWEEGRGYLPFSQYAYCGGKMFCGSATPSAFAA
jgi:hypothetical protein